MTTIPDSMPVLQHPSWCDPDACYLDFDGGATEVLHSTADRPVEGLDVNVYAVAGTYEDTATQINLDGHVEFVTPAQARAVAAALIAVADQVDGATVN